MVVQLIEFIHSLAFDNSHNHFLFQIHAVTSDPEPYNLKNNLKSNAKHVIHLTV